MTYKKETVTTMSESTTSKNIVNIDELVAGIKALENSRDYTVNQYNARIAEKQVLLDKAKSLGLEETVVVVEPISTVEE